MNKEKKIKVYTYTRVSTAMQVDGYSLDAQKAKMKAYADYNDYEIVGEYEDAGKSGKSIEGRAQFSQMMEDIKSGKDGVSYVLVFKLSRFGRNAADVLSSLQVMQDFGVNLVCVEDGIDSSKDAGKLMISVLSAVAEIERENIRVQTMEGRIQKAREGVEVRVLFDSMGCRTMKNRDWERLEKEGIQVAEFFPALLGQLQLRVNYRNHRKIVVIDGRVGFVGGFNVGREYLGRDKKFGYWRDTHLCIEGAAVTSLAVRFVLDWNYAAKENLFLEDSLFEIPQYTRNGRDPVQIISSGPASKTKMIHDNYLRLIHRAQDHVYIQTPYFIPDDSILDALKIAAKSGVDVRIMIPCKPDHPFVYWATYSYIGEMVAAGAKCYVYNNGFLHAKTLSIDGMVACVGTANMDFRSFGLNFEVNAVIYSERTVQRLERAFENDMTLCTQVTRKVYDERGLVIKAKEQFSRLLSPLL